MLTKLAWKNVWRNRGRSFVVIAAIVLGIWSAIFMMSFSLGMVEGRVEAAVNTEVSHLQAHHPDFEKDMNPGLVVPDGEQIMAALREDPRVKAVAPRLVVQGMIRSTRGGRPGGGRLIGINKAMEQQLTDLHTRIDSGEYLPETRMPSAFVGGKLAEDLKLRLKSKIQVTFMDDHGQQRSPVYVVMGVFSTQNSAYDRSTIFVEQENLRKFLGTDSIPFEGYHEIAALTHNLNEVDSVVADLRAAFPDALIEPWNEVVAELGMMIEFMDIGMLVFMSIIMLALIFGIINTMLMAVLERTREIGMLMAVGMNKTRVFFMILAETMFLAIVGGPIGLGAGFLTVSWLGNSGIDLSQFSQGMESMGFSAVIYLSLSTKYYLILSGMVVGTAFLASIPAALRAIRLKPNEAIRKI